MKIRLALGAALALTLSAAACGSSNNNNPADAKVITNPPDANVDAPVVPSDASCITNPDPNDSTQLINACTTSQKVDKHPALPLQYSDGGLPPLPQ